MKQPIRTPSHAPYDYSWQQITQSFLFKCWTFICVSCPTDRPLTPFKKCLNHNNGEKEPKISHQAPHPPFPIICLYQKTECGQLGARASNCTTHRLWKVASLMSEGQPLSSSITVFLTILPFLRVFIPLCSPAFVSCEAQCDVSEGHVNVISMQQTTALRETVTFGCCPSG